jgi:hypothetical protein
MSQIGDFMVGSLPADSFLGGALFDLDGKGSGDASPSRARKPSKFAATNLAPRRQRKREAASVF